jgi:hypothetical protein
VFAGRGKDKSRCRRQGRQGQGRPQEEKVVTLHRRLLLLILRLAPKRRRIGSLVGEYVALPHNLWQCRGSCLAVLFFWRERTQAAALAASMSGQAVCCSSAQFGASMHAGKAALLQSSTCCFILFTVQIQKTVSMHHHATGATTDTPQTRALVASRPSPPAPKMEKLEARCDSRGRYQKPKTPLQIFPGRPHLTAARR